MWAHAVSVITVTCSCGWMSRHTRMALRAPGRSSGSMPVRFAFVSAIMHWTTASRSPPDSW